MSAPCSVSRAMVAGEARTRDHERRDQIHHRVDLGDVDAEQVPPVLDVVGRALLGERAAGLLDRVGATTRPCLRARRRAARRRPARSPQAAARVSSLASVMTSITKASPPGAASLGDIETGSTLTISLTAPTRSRTLLIVIPAAARAGDGTKARRRARLPIPAAPSSIARSAAPTFSASAASRRIGPAGRRAVLTARPSRPSSFGEERSAAPPRPRSPPGGDVAEPPPRSPRRPELGRSTTGRGQRPAPLPSSTARRAASTRCEIATIGSIATIAETPLMVWSDRKTSPTASGFGAPLRPAASSARSFWLAFARCSSTLRDVRGQELRAGRRLKAPRRPALRRRRGCPRA